LHTPEIGFTRKFLAAWGVGHAPFPEIGFTRKFLAARGVGHAPRYWVHKEIPGCTVELNTQNCAWFGSKISLITAISFREAMPLRTTHQGLYPWTPLGDSKIAVRYWRNAVR